jgi:thiosulfate/3-mercaptopyruvate sulfurtransferase
MGNTATATRPLVRAEWALEHLNDEAVRIVEVSEDTSLYGTGHIPGAGRLVVEGDLNELVTRELASPATIAAALTREGVDNDTHIVLYGDKTNWWAAYAYWILRLYGHDSVSLLDGGRTRWEQLGYDYDTTVASRAGNYNAGVRDDSTLRILRNELVDIVGDGTDVGVKLVDVRSPLEYSGERTHMPEYPNEGALRGGHIPTAKNIPWAKAVAADGTFLPVDQLRELYESQGITGDADIVTYCRVGERGSHTWFALTQLLGYESVRNYDGSWTEWGNLVGVPIEKDYVPGA